VRQKTKRRQRFLCKLAPCLLHHAALRNITPALAPLCNRRKYDTICAVEPNGITPNGITPNGKVDLREKTTKRRPG
jgi:hypothetical protein